jgi:HEAT repeat protein
MLHVLATLFLALPFQVEEPKPVDPAKKQTAISELTRAFDKEGGPEARAAAISRCHELVDPEVIGLVRKGLDDKDERVVEAAVTALGALKHKSSLEALHGYLKREKKKLEANDRLYPLLLKEIGRHGDEASIGLLADDAFDQRAYATAQARIMALGNIRSAKSIEALIDMSKKVGVHRMDGLRQDMRLALARLAGRDLGAVSTQWAAWWQDNKKGFEIAKTPPKLEPAMERQWMRYWGVEAAGEGDGETGGGRRRGRD